MKVLYVTLLYICLAHGSSKFVKKLPFVVVNETNREALGGLPIDTIVVQDQKIKLYWRKRLSTKNFNPKGNMFLAPELSETYSAEDRMQVMWIKSGARDNYCKVGPDRLDPANFKWDYFWHEFCRSYNGEDICCGDGVCSCFSMGFVARFSCACVTPETAKYYKDKQKEDFETAMKIGTALQRTRGEGFRRSWQSNSRRRLKLVWSLGIGY